VVILADRMSGGEWQGDDGVTLLKRLSQTASDALILCAGHSQRELIDRGVTELKFRRARLFGSAPESLASGARAMVALALNGSPRDVSLSLLGVPPAHVVIPWADATVAGFALTRLVDEPSRRRLSARIAALWPTGPYALAAAATLCVEAIAGRSRRIVSCFIAAESTGTHTRTGAMPVRLGPAGVVDVVLPSLDAIEQVAFDNAMQV
jgi:malate/lactate dehydrogenase